MIVGWGKSWIGMLFTRLQGSNHSLWYWLVSQQLSLIVLKYRKNSSVIVRSINSGLFHFLKGHNSQLGKDFLEVNILLFKYHSLPLISLWFINPSMLKYLCTLCRKLLYFPKAKLSQWLTTPQAVSFFLACWAKDAQRLQSGEWPFSTFSESRK